MRLTVKSSITACDTYCNDKCPPLFMEKYVISVLENGTTITIWKPGVILEEMTTLLGHDRLVTSLAVSPSDNRYLCSCSEDKTIIWNISTILNGAQGDCVTSASFGLLGYVEYCAINWSNTWLALCKEKGIWIMKLQISDQGSINVRHHSRLETNALQGNLCTFSSEHHDILVTVEDSCFFKVWNVQTVTLTYQSHRLGMYTITYCTFSNHPSWLLLGTNGGVIHVYKVKKEGQPCCVMKASVGKEFTKSSRPSTRGGEERVSTPRSRASDAGEGGDDCVEAGCVILYISLFTSISGETKVNNNCKKLQEEEEEEEEEVPGFKWDTTDILKSILAPGPVIIVCCNLGIVLYSCNSWECLSKVTVQDMVPSTLACPTGLPLLNFMLLGGESMNKLTCVMRTSFWRPKLHIVILQGVESNKCNVMVMPKEPVLTKSPLRYQLNKSQTLKEYRVKTLPIKGYKTSKSSGYGKAPRMQMFSPTINPKSKVKNFVSSKKQVIEQVCVVENCIPELLFTSGPPMKVKDKVCVWDTSGTAIHLAASGDGKYIACSSTSSLLCVLKFSDMNPDQGLNLIGHDAAINSLHFSLNSNWLVSSSNDCTAKVWDWRNKKCILNIDKRTKYIKVNGRLKQDSTLCRSVSQARFFYMDQFILLATKGSMELYSHILHETTPGSKSLDPKTDCKRVCEIAVPTQQVTCFSAVNQFHSYLMLCGCSNRTVQVYDLNVERFVLELRDVHTRSPHRLCQMEGSNAVTHPPAMMDLFLTAALCDGTKLWDLRSARCVQKYCQHTSRAYTSGIDISPCGRFVAVGSEDKCVYIYDTRKCAEYLNKLCGLGEVVMDVAFNPCRPILAAAALNGCIASYTSENML
ncbi:WD repeat-containing protein 27 [Anabrus simplex]|uniref:WD repeat-containing protein 27 n=1 Tax=Anabrus simplex TaxID=316456 RepID=UPI0035A30E89